MSDRMWFRWNNFVMNWFPYRTTEFLGYDEQTNEVEWGETRWNAPWMWRKRKFWK